MRRVLVTGANKGIGLAIAKAIIAEHEDTFVLLGSRDVGRGHAARDELLSRYPDAVNRAQVLALDVTDDASVRLAAKQAAESFGRQSPPLYGIVNNAGIGGSSAMRQVLDVNLHGIRRVCDAFLPLLEPSRGRIVNVTSAAGPNFVSRCSPERQQELIDPNIDWSTIESLAEECLALEGDAAAFAAKGLGNGDPYGLSKALANSYTVLLAREHPNLRINACTPGYIETDLTRQRASEKGKTPAEMGMKSPEEGARSALYLLFGEPEGNGRYYGSDAQRSPLDRYRSPGSEPYAGD